MATRFKSAATALVAATLSVPLALAAAAEQQASTAMETRQPEANQQMEAMRARMETMQAQMDQLRKTQDRGERRKLLGEHMQAMMAQMQDMRMMGGDSMMGMMGSGGGTGMGAMHGGGMMGSRDMMPSRPADAAPGPRHRMMQDRMDMMQMMMEQMMEHLQAQQDLGASSK